MKEGLISELKYLLYAMFIYLNIDMDVFRVLIMFMVIDTVSGSIKAIRLDYKEFYIKRLMWGFVSKIGILIIPLVVALLLKGLGIKNDIGFGVMLIVKILIVSEFISSIGNIYTIKTKIIVKDVDIFTMLFKFLRMNALRLLQKYTKIELNIKEEEDEKD